MIDLGADPAPVFASWNGFAGRVHAEGGTVSRVLAEGDVTPVDLSKLAGAGVIEFGPGVFRLTGTLWLKDDVASLEIRGARCAS